MLDRDQPLDGASTAPPVESTAPADVVDAEYVRRAYERAIDWYKVAETKAQLLLTVNSVLVTVGFGIVLGRITEAHALAGTSGVETWVFLFLAIAAFIGAISSAAACLWSRHSRNAKQAFVYLGVDPADPASYCPEVLWYFGHLAFLGPPRTACQQSPLTAVERDPLLDDQAAGQRAQVRPVHTRVASRSGLKPVHPTRRNRHLSTQSDPADCASRMLASGSGQRLVRGPAVAAETAGPVGIGRVETRGRDHERAGVIPVPCSAGVDVGAPAPARASGSRCVDGSAATVRPGSAAGQVISLQETAPAGLGGQYGNTWGTWQHKFKAVDCQARPVPAPSVIAGAAASRRGCRL